MPAAKEGRDDPSWDIFGMAGVPDGMKPGDAVPKPGQQAGGPAAPAVAAPVAAPTMAPPVMSAPPPAAPYGMPPPGPYGAPPP